MGRAGPNPAISVQGGGHDRQNSRQFATKLPTIDSKTIDPLFNLLLKSGQISVEMTVCGPCVMVNVSLRLVNARGFEK